MKAIADFVAQLKSDIHLDDKFVIEKKSRYFLLNNKLKAHIKKEFYHAGVYLGKIKNGRFFPSFNLLAMMAKGKANKIRVDSKTEWLFVCGRDIFKQGIIESSKPIKKGEYTLVLNQYGECIGFGKLLHDSKVAKTPHKVVVKNISDIGDFLRRER
jgi:ribosome biogenesis protein Nip4